jgi:hypothetical protein
MSRESLIFLLVVLAVWGLSVAARWLQQEIERSTADEIKFEPDKGSLRLEQPISTIETTKPLLPSVPEEEKQTRQKKLSNQLGLDNIQKVRHGIILMTVLGPCRANDPINTLRYF